MAVRTLPNMGLRAFYALGEDGWKDDMDLGLLKLSALVQGRVISKVDALPGAPALGDVYLCSGAHPTNPNQIAIRDGEAGAVTWVFVVPKSGWLLYNVAAGYYESFSGAVWAQFAGGGGGGSLSAVTPVAAAAYDLLAADVGTYLRFTNDAAKTVNVRPNATEALPANGEWNIRNAGVAALTISAGAGVTINAPAGGTLVVPQGGTVTLKRIAANVFDLLGATVAA